jgi:hypothetical protein
MCEVGLLVDHEASLLQSLSVQNELIVLLAVDAPYQKCSKSATRNNSLVTLGRDARTNSNLGGTPRGGMSIRVELPHLRK